MSEELLYYERCHLKPEVAVFDKQFVDCFTGERLERAFLIDDQYGSYRDPIIAATHLKWLEDKKMISNSLLEDFLEKINKQCLVKAIPHIPQLIRGVDPKRCLIDGTYENQIFESHKQTGSDKTGTNFDKLLKRVVDVKSLKKLYSLKQQQVTTTININKRKRESNNNNKNQQQQEKKICVYILNQDVEEKKIIKELKTNETLTLDEPFFVKSIHLNYNHGTLLIYLSDNKNEDCNCYANNLNHGSDQKIKGNTILLSTKQIYPDGESTNKKTKK